MTKRRRAGPSQRSASVSTWLSLPEDVLLRMLALLDPQDLMTARLVCRQWKLACLACCKSASPSEWPDFGEASLEEQRTMLESRLQILTGLTGIALDIFRPEDAALLNVPGCSAMLRNIDINFNRVIRQAVEQHGSAARPSRVKALLAADLAPLANLTGLTSFQAEFPPKDVGRPAPLQALLLDVGSQILQHCTQLRVVDLTCNASEWMQLLPHLASLPHLRVVEQVPMGEGAVLERVAALTQLTGLSLSGKAVPESLMCLTAMTALKGLVASPAPVDAVVQAVSFLTQLERLVLQFGGHNTLPRSEAVLAPLRCLTILKICTKGDVIVPQSLFRDSLTRLALLALDVVSVRGGSWHLSRSLRHLYLSTPKHYGKALLEEVAALTGLVSLRLGFLDSPKRWSTAAKHNAPWRAATFLSGLTGLQCLNLLYVLHAGNMAEDVRCIAALTNLGSLGLHGKCSCHGMKSESDSEDDWLTAAIKRAPEGVQEQGSCPKSVQALDSRGGFMQLLSLRYLSHLAVSGPWSAIDESGFSKALDGIRRKMGRPPLTVSWDNDWTG